MRNSLESFLAISTATSSGLGPLGDSKIIILNDFDDDGEAQEEKTPGIESTTAPASADDAPAEAKVGNSDDQGPD
jgi:hypothetical protein